MTNEIALVPSKETAVQVYSTPNGLDPFLAKVREEIDAFVPDVTTPKGRKEIASVAYKVAQSKTALDSMGKELVAELKDIPRKIDEERKRMRDLLDMWKDEVRKPLTDWEEAEERRVKGIKDRLSLFDAYTDNQNSAKLTTVLKEIESIAIDDSWQEFLTDAAKAKDACINRFKVAIMEQEKAESEAAEQERIRKDAEEKARIEREEQIRKEAAEIERKAAEHRAEQERQRVEQQQIAAQQEADRKEREHQAALERARREKAEAEAAALRQQQEAADRARIAAEQAEREKQAAIEAERNRIEAQRIADQQEAEKKAANKAYRRQINREALDDLIAYGITEPSARALIESIARGEIRHITVNY
jgi:hypothetical protein